jgi:acyl-CoA synthetase (AMP-forming)/AMP-acid ligase II
MKFETGKEVLMGLLPFYHIYGMMVLQFGTLAQGAKLIIHPKFEPAAFLQSVQDHEVRRSEIYIFITHQWHTYDSLKTVLYGCAYIFT